MKSRFTIAAPRTDVVDQLPSVVALARVAQFSSFTRAAAELDVSTSALSQSIKALESRAGVRLLNRTTRRVALTEAGQQLLERIGPALQTFDTAFESLDEMRGSPNGTLKINLSRAAADHILAPVLKEYVRRCPDVTIDLTVDDGLGDLVGDGYDAGVRLGEQLARDMVAVPIGPKLSMAVVASPEYLRTHGKPARPQELTQHRCLRYRFRTTGEIYHWEFTEAGRDFSMDVPTHFISSDSEVLAQAARQGLGIACLLDICVQKDIAAGTLVRLFESWCPAFPGYYLYYPHRTHVPLKLRMLIDVIHERQRSARGPKRKRK
ncbi:MAG TPA: LysR family transcriptional regulator [Steroidobacteraceae bacterium]|nr:LysR family transcriptional regulator [Steroidobacteraceae bacterium]